VRTGLDVLAERGVDVTAPTIPAEEFSRVGLPLVVACTGCDTTMAMPCAMVDDLNRCWCDDCAPED